MGGAGHERISIETLSNIRIHYRYLGSYAWDNELVNLLYRTVYQPQVQRQACSGQDCPGFDCDRIPSTDMQPQPPLVQDDAPLPDAGPLLLLPIAQSVEYYEYRGRGRVPCVLPSPSLPPSSKWGIQLEDGSSGYDVCIQYEVRDTLMFIMPCKMGAPYFIFLTRR